jgi:hypothetical protein
LQSRARLDRVSALAAVKGAEPAAKLLIEFRQLTGAHGLMFLQKPESFANDLTRRVVPARPDLSANKLL